MSDKGCTISLSGRHRWAWNMGLDVRRNDLVVVTRCSYCGKERTRRWVPTRTRPERTPA